ncbi:hypothetical protein FF1_010227 [Malus domestica]
MSPSKAFVSPEEGFGSTWMSFKLQRGREVVQRRIAPSMQWDETSIEGCATIVYVDVYAIKYDLIANAMKYGFSSPLMACCGNGGPPYNYNIGLTCGHRGSNVCDEGSRYVSWDGIHFTEAANTIVASKILSTKYSTPSIPFDFFCRG